jgi:hypothetical protein
MADNWINERYLFLVHPDRRPTLEWFLEMAEVAGTKTQSKLHQEFRREVCRSQRSNSKTTGRSVGTTELATPTHATRALSGRFEIGCQACSSSSSALASFKESVSKPSVNQP